MERIYVYLESIMGENWKTYTGGVMILSSIVFDLIGYKTIAKIVYDGGVALGIIGLGHKASRLLEK